MSDPAGAPRRPEAAPEVPARERLIGREGGRPAALTIPEVVRSALVAVPVLHSPHPATPDECNSVIGIRSAHPRGAGGGACGRARGE